jgi:hypothetical protein
VAAIVALAGGCTGDAPTPTPVPTAVAETASDPRVVVHPRAGLDDVLLLGAPYGVEDRGILLTIDLASGEVVKRIHAGELWRPGMKEPTLDPEHPDAESAARSPDGEHVAVFTRSTDTRKTGITIVTGDRERFHHLQSVGAVVGGRLVWSPSSDAVYLIAASADGSADRVIGVPLGGSPQTVVRIDERGFQWLLVR